MPISVLPQDKDEQALFKAISSVLRIFDQPTIIPDTVTTKEFSLMINNDISESFSPVSASTEWFLLP